MKLIKHEIIDGELECLTGCRIGGTESGFEIAGIDNPIITNPLDGLPYIPGSSLKGKIRCLLELRYDKISTDERGVGNPCDCGDCFICVLFGCSRAKKTKSPTRLIFRDLFLSNKSIESIGEVLKDYTEVKTEVKIDRETMTSTDPRENFRVPAGAKFRFELSIRIFETDQAQLKDWMDKLAEGFELLEEDYLGGSGTRGYGKVKFTHNDKPLSEYIRSMEWK